MSLNIVKKEIFRFLESSTPEVLAIKGAWGVGKTFAWNKFLLEAKEDKKIACKKYSYVSLFGINSLDSFRYTVFEQLINIKLIGTEPSLETFKDNWAGVSASFGKKIAKYAGELPYLKKFFPTIESIFILSAHFLIFGRPIPAPKPNSCTLGGAVEKPGCIACSVSGIPGPESIASTLILSGLT